MSGDSHDASRRKALVTVTTAASGIAVIGAATPFLASLGVAELHSKADEDVLRVEIDAAAVHELDWPR